jgi:hypothetical protein
MPSATTPRIRNKHKTTHGVTAPGRLGRFNLLERLFINQLSSITTQQMSLSVSIRVHLWLTQNDIGITLVLVNVIEPGNNTPGDQT